MCNNYIQNNNCIKNELLQKYATIVQNIIYYITHGKNFTKIFFSFLIVYSCIIIIDCLCIYALTYIYTLFSKFVYVYFSYCRNLSHA